MYFRDLAALTALRNDPLGAACARGGAGLDATTWDLIGIDYQDVCAR